MCCRGAKTLAVAISGEAETAALVPLVAAGAAAVAKGWPRIDEPWPALAPGASSGPSGRGAGPVAGDPGAMPIGAMGLLWAPCMRPPRATPAAGTCPTREPAGTPGGPQTPPGTREVTGATPSAEIDDACPGALQSTTPVTGNPPHDAAPSVGRGAESHEASPASALAAGASQALGCGTSEGLSRFSSSTRSSAGIVNSEGPTGGTGSLLGPYTGADVSTMPPAGTVDDGAGSPLGFDRQSSSRSRAGAFHSGMAGVARASAGASRVAEGGEPRGPSDLPSCPLPLPPFPAFSALPLPSPLPSPLVPLSPFSVGGGGKPLDFSRSALA
mmetsp:Transcript_25596/g.65794  ORF Transcript_25596/g.65794 Transcript_25596/m.65794 type:complete len:328 (-) Transcript_25596:532-1515(-)